MLGGCTAPKGWPQLAVECVVFGRRARLAALDSAAEGRSRGGQAGPPEPGPWDGTTSGALVSGAMDRDAGMVRPRRAGVSRAELLAIRAEAAGDSALAVWRAGRVSGLIAAAARTRLESGARITARIRRGAGR